MTDHDLVKSALLSALEDQSGRIVKLALRVPVENCLRLVDAEEVRYNFCSEVGVIAGILLQDVVNESFNLCIICLGLFIAIGG